MSEMNNKNPFEQILDETNQLIQICDCETLSMLYANKSARKFSKHDDPPYQGIKCYQYMMGLDEQCPFCPIRQITDQESIITEVDNGHNVFSVNTKRIQWEGKDAYIEYATDITAIRRAQAMFDAQMKILVDSIPEAQGIFHINVTKDTWVSSNGLSRIVEDLKHAQTVNELVESLSSYIPDREMRERVYHSLCRESLLTAFSKGKTEIPEETLSYYDDGSVRWSRITARLIMNPSNGDLEGIIYGMDISDERKYKEKIAEVELEKSLVEAKSMQDILTGVFNKTAFEEIANDYIRVYPKQSFAVIFIDLDNFKAVNDNLGHLFGDKVIIEIADELQSIFSNRDIISRFGGDEFCILIKNIAFDNLLDKLDITLKRLLKTYSDNQKEVKVSASIGVAYCEGSTESIIPWIEKSDMALYQAKRNGRNQYQII